MDDALHGGMGTNQGSSDVSGTPGTVERSVEVSRCSILASCVLRAR